MIVVLWRAGLRISEALTLAESDLDSACGSILVRRGKGGGRRREIGMDPWGWEHLRPWLDLRTDLPVGALFCVLNGPYSWPAVVCDRGPDPSAPARRTAGVRRRFARHQLRHAHAVEMAREGIPLNVIQRQLGRPRHHQRLPPSPSSAARRGCWRSKGVSERAFYYAERVFDVYLGG
ncbi:MAG: tyrosine-type recombinase/integrase [Thermoleophilaceae bacterium]